MTYHPHEELETKKRTIVKVKVEIFDSQNNKTLTVIFDWFISKKNEKS